jgi:hypothetical protein
VTYFCTEGCTSTLGTSRQAHSALVLTPDMERTASFP